MNEFEASLEILRMVTSSKSSEEQKSSKNPEEILEQFAVIHQKLSELKRIDDLKHRTEKAEKIIEFYKSISKLEGLGSQERDALFKSVVDVLSQSNGTKSNDTKSGKVVMS